MLKFLVALDHSVESSFALRCACSMARGRDVQLETFHVAEPPSRGRAFGAGWAIHTYESQYLKDVYLEMAGIIASQREELGTVPVLKVVSGSPVKQIVQEVEEGNFDALFLGSVHPLEGHDRGILLKLLARLFCPFVIVKHYRPLRRAMILVDDDEPPPRALEKVSTLLQGLPLRIDVVRFTGSASQEEAQEVLTGWRLALEASVANLETRVIQGNPASDLPEIAADYGLVIQRRTPSGKPGPVSLRLLRTLPSPVMLWG
jgi:nucleotide-binding universal stress UspA family protein